MKLLLHIGMHKTGTSALQAFLRSQGARLLAHGALYPAHGQHHDGAHHGLWHALANQDQAAAFVRAIQAEVAESPRAVDTVILSSELLEKIGQDPERAQSIKALISAFDTVEVLYFLRNQGELIQSIYKQWIKDDAMRVGVGPTQFIATHEGSLNYSHYARWWADLAPHVTLRCGLYTGEWSSLWVQFCSLAGLDLDGNRMERSYNPSMDGPCLKLKHWVNRNVPKAYVDFPLNTWLQKNFANEPRTSMFQDEGDFRRFQAQFKDDNALMARTWGVDGLDHGRVSGAFFQTASPRLVDSFMQKMSANPATAESLILNFRS